MIHIIEHIATLDPLLPEQQVWISERRDIGVIVEHNHNYQDHNYIVSTPMGELRRNRQHLTQILNSENTDSRQEQTPQQETIVPTESTS